MRAEESSTEYKKMMVTLFALIIALSIAGCFFYRYMLRGFEQSIKWFDHRNIRREQHQEPPIRKNRPSTKGKLPTKQQAAIEEEEEWPEVITL